MKYLLSFNLFELKNNSNINIESKEQLESLLIKYNIPLEKWGTGGFKTVEHLWNEILEEECVLSEKDGKLIRDVEFVGAKIIFKRDGVNYRLWEDRAVFKDGRIRIRPIPHSMAEKFKHDENPKDALIRGLQEELGIEINHNQFTYYNRDRFENNTDYPGIHSYHTGYHYFIALNEEQFNPKGYVEEQKDKTIYFVWRKIQKKPLGHYPLPIGKDNAFESKKLRYLF